MPKFTEQEKKRIQETLLENGERLFVEYGLKRVTIDELARSAQIAKATFYSFYPGKEALFLDIAQKEQNRIFAQLENILTNNKTETDKERVRQVFFHMSELVCQYPLLLRIDPETTEQILRRVSPERLAAFRSQGFDAVKAMVQHGIRFKYSPELVSTVFETLYQLWIGLTNQPKETQAEVIGIILEGVLDRIL